MHLFELWSDTWLQYAAMGLSLIGLLKNNFLAETFLQVPNVGSMTTANEVDKTQYIIAQMAEVSKGVLTVGSAVGFASGFLGDSAHYANSDLAPFFFYMFAFTLMFFGASFGLMQQYGLQALMSDWTAS